MGLRRFLCSCLIFVLFRTQVSSANFTDYPQKYLIESILVKEIKHGGIAEGVQFLCYAMNSDDLFTLKLHDEKTADKLLIQDRLVFILHGWMDEGTSRWVQDIQSTWRQFQDANICAVDWRKFAGQDYKTAMLKLYRVGNTMAQMVKWLESYRGFGRANMILVGYSLGAHAAGYAGSLLNGQIGEIIGLDPAGPLFTFPYDIGRKYRLDEGDARFVQVMHTSSGTLGTVQKCGHADFYPNGGASPQSNCVYPSNTNENNKNPVGCSHSSVVKFFKFSMNPDYPYSGWDCANYKHFTLGLCRWNKVSRFGIHSERRKGNFYFSTLIDPPYVEQRRGKGDFSWNSTKTKRV